MKFERRTVVGVLLACVVATMVRAGDDVFPLKVPHARLVSQPQAYEGKLIRVEGYLSLEQEDNRLYPTHVHYEHFLREEAVLVAIDWRRDAQYANRARKYVAVTGI